MNQECTSPAADTPATRCRAAFESAGFSIEGVPNDVTADQVVEIAQALVEKIDRLSLEAQQ